MIQVKCVRSLVDYADAKLQRLALDAHGNRNPTRLTYIGMADNIGAQFMQGQQDVVSGRFRFRQGLDTGQHPFNRLLERL